MFSRALRLRTIVVIKAQTLEHKLVRTPTVCIVTATKPRALKIYTA